MHTRTLYYGDPINRSNPLMRGLVSRWKVVPWYASGPRLIDLGGFRNHGTLTNSPLWSGSIGRQGGSGSIFFDGTNDMVAIGNPASLEPSSWNGLSLGIWVKRNATGHWDSLIDKGAEFAAASGINVNFGIRKSDVVRFRVSDGTTLNGVESGTVTVDTAWHHIVGTWTGDTAANGISVYIDGKLTDQATATYSQSSMSSATSRNWALAGNNGSSLPFGGRLDDAFVMARCLSATEVFSLFQAPRQPYDPTLNWIDEDYYLGTAGAGGFKGYWASQRPRIIGGGVT